MESAAAAACITLTVAEIRKLLWHMVWAAVPSFMAIVSWSLWRRRHQAIAQLYHYLRRNANVKLQL
jgi:hypothetical protein